MPVLYNKKHEKIARLIAKGKTKRDAYRATYPDSSFATASSMAYQIANRPEVNNRVTEILETIPEASLNNVIKSVSKSLKSTKEVIFNNKGASKFIKDNVAIANAQEKLLKLHGVQGFATQQTTINDNRQQVLAITGDEITQLAHVLADLKGIGNIAEDTPEQTGEVIDV